MKTENSHRRIEGYLNMLKSDSDKLSQFYEAAIIAKNALIEVDKLNKALLLIIEESKVHGYSGKQSMKHIAQKALGIEVTDPIVINIKK